MKNKILTQLIKNRDKNLSYLNTISDDEKTELLMIYLKAKKVLENKKDLEIIDEKINQVKYSLKDKV